ncbi:hypothetical protein IIA94_01390 [Patescibacteria group bacterium]|nr:hypothetical protein [Patescibacteria group bacterium]
MANENEQVLTLQEARLKGAQKQDVADKSQRTQTEPRINPIVAGLILGFVIIGEIIASLLALIPLIGWIIAAIIKGVLWFTVSMWVWTGNLKRPPLFLGLGGLDFIPIFGDILPTYVGMVIGIIVYNKAAIKIKKLATTGRV